MSLLVKPVSHIRTLTGKLIKKIEPHDFKALLAVSSSSSLPPSLSLFFFLFHPLLLFSILSSNNLLQDLASVHGFCHKRLTSPIKENENLSNDQINDKSPGFFVNFLQHILGMG